MRIHRGRWQNGFSLLEVAVAASILAFGFSGLAALLINSVAHSARSTHRTQATLLSESLAAQLDMAGPGAPANDFADRSLATWQARVGETLPSGQGLICRDTTPDDGRPDAPECDGLGPLTIKVFWHDKGEEWAQHAHPVEL